MTLLTMAIHTKVGEEELFLGKTWKLNAERNNGRGAMMGITGTSPEDTPLGYSLKPASLRLDHQYILYLTTPLKTSP